MIRNVLDLKVELYMNFANGTYICVKTNSFMLELECK